MVSTHKRPRSADTYRAARRNSCRRERRVWGSAPGDYHHEFTPNRLRRTILARTPSRYHPMKSVQDYLRSIGKKIGW